MPSTPPCLRRSASDGCALKSAASDLAKPTRSSGSIFARTLASSADAVDAFHRLALVQGGSDDGQPGFRDRGVGPNRYYAAFIRDADGNRIEAVTFVQPG